MIVSHKHKFIFLKTNKTAGTSVEIALSRFCGADDVITPISPKDEKTRKGLGYRGAQNYRTPLSGYSFKDFFAVLLHGKLKKRFYNHMQAKEAQCHIPCEIWNEYFKFTIERNPFDRCISHYYFAHKKEPRPSLSEHVNLQSHDLKRKGYYLYTANDVVVVDKICRFEALSAELENVRLTLGLPEPLNLPNAKSGYRKDNSSHREIIDDKTRNKIASLFSEEMDLMEYHW